MPEITSDPTTPDTTTLDPTTLDPTSLDPTTLGPTHDTFSGASAAAGRKAASAPDVTTQTAPAPVMHIAPKPKKTARPRRSGARASPSDAAPKGQSERSVPTTPTPRRQDQRRTLGALGEDLVAGWYERSGFIIVDRNWRVSRGEIDLVAAKGRLLVFCEVKTRSSAGFGLAVEAVTPTKQARLRSLAMAWLAAHPDVHPNAMRFDVAALTGTDVAVVVGAF